MNPVEFDAVVSNGMIEIPDRYREHLHGTVRVVVLGAGQMSHDSWPVNNKRRWELIEKKLEGPLSDREAHELARLQQLAEAELADVGPRPLVELERLEAELSKQS
jgi:hypothetical protein